MARKNAWISLEIDFGNGIREKWVDVQIPYDSSDSVHLRIWEETEKFIKKKVKELQSKKN